MAKKSPKAEVQAETNPEQSPEVTEATAAPVEQASQEPAVSIDEAFAALDEAPAEVQPDPTAPIVFDEPPSAVDTSKAVFSDEPELSKADLDSLYKEANRDNTMRDFTLKVLEARKPPEQVAAMPPVADRIRSQTEAEMAAGAKMNKHYDELHARHGRPRPEPDKSTAVFRPGDFVPDPKKSQGHVGARNL